MVINAQRWKKQLDKLSLRDWILMGAAIVVVIAVFLAFALRPKADVAASAALDDVRSRGVVRVGVQVDLPKFAYQGEDGLITGLDVDIAAAIAARIFEGDGTKVELVPVTLNTRIPKLSSGQIDCSLAMIPQGINTKAAYSTPYYYDAIGMLVRSDDPSANLTALANRNIGVLSRPSIAAKAFTARQAVEDYAKDHRVTYTITEFAAIPDLLDALSAGEVDGAALEYALIQAYFNDDYRVLPEAVATEPYCIAVSATNEPMMEVVNDVIKKLQSSGELKAMWDKWGLTDYRR